jgi:3-oxoacyl-[acyl-carrier-protein] synthase II
VITGLGAVTPLGNDVHSTWENLITGRATAGPITAFDTTGFPVTFACEAKGFDPTQWIDRKQVRRMDRFAQLIVAAAHQARADAGLEVEPECDRVGVSVATAMGGLESFEDACETLIERGPGRVNPFAIPTIIPNMGAAQISIELGTTGPLTSQCTACAASAMAIGDGLDAIRIGRADVMLTGGSEAPITRVGIAGFSAMLVLEELGHATQRGARIYAELVGYGISSDAKHLTEPDPTGESPARAMRMAFADAGISPEQVDYINAHGTSTPLGDASETRVIKRALGEHIARSVPVSSTKGATGHTLGASGAVEAIFCTLAIHEGVLPPTINYEKPDPECDLDYVPNEARRADVGVAVSNSSGFGGHNASIVLRRFAG